MEPMNKRHTVDPSIASQAAAMQPPEGATPEQLATFYAMQKFCTEGETPEPAAELLTRAYTGNLQPQQLGKDDQSVVDAYKAAMEGGVRGTGKHIGPGMIAPMGGRR